MDAAALSLSIDSSSVVKATKDLDQFSASADRAAAAAGRAGAGGNAAKAAADLARAADKASQYSGAAMRAAAANDNVAAAAQRMATANDNAGRAVAASDAHVIAHTQHLAALARTQQDANAHVMAWQRHQQTLAPIMGQADAHVIAYRNSLRQVGTAIQFTARDGLNATRQLADIGTTALMGMNPFLIAVQQGPQLFDLLQEKALVTGTSISAVFKAAGATIWAALAPLLPLIAAIAAVIALITGAFALAAREINKGADSATERLGLTEKQLERVKEAGVNTGVTIADTFFGFFDVVGERLTAAFEGPLKWLADAWNATMDFIVKYGLIAIKGIIGGFTGAYYAIAAVWGLLPGAIADLTVQAANWALTKLQDMINGAIDLLNGLIGMLPEWLVGASPERIAHVKIGLFENGYEGKAAAAGEVAGKAFWEGFSAGGAAVDRFIADVGKAASARRDRRILDAAGKAEKASGAGGKSDAEKLADILRNAQAEITAQENRAKAVGMSARATAELEQRTKLLNQVAKAGIPITGKLALTIDKLAKSYADAKIAADVAVVIEGVTDSIRKQNDAVNDETSLIGLYGDALIRARNETEALRRAQESLPRGETLSDGDATRVALAAAKLSRDEILQGQLKRAEDLRKTSEDAAYAMGLELKGLHLTGEAALAYAFTAEKLNEAKRAGITLTPEYVAAIDAAGAAYAKQRFEIDRQRQAIADTRQVVKGFFTDWIGKVREGAKVFKSFADTVVNSLNRIIDKLLDKSLDAFLDKMLSGGGNTGGSGFLNTLTSFVSSLYGGSGGGGDFGSVKAGLGSFKGGYAHGGAFDQAQRFAKGGAFTNSIVNTPTLFRFANGAALGEMGEAGPEGIFPLKRGPNGDLGVQAHGGGGRPVVRMGDVTNHFSFAGAVGIDGIAAMVRQGGEATYNQVKRDLESLLQQLDADGSFSS